VLTEVLGLSATEIARLVDAQVIADPDCRTHVPEDAA